MAQQTTGIANKTTGSTLSAAEFETLDDTVNANATDAESRIAAAEGTLATLDTAQKIASLIDADATAESTLAAALSVPTAPSDIGAVPTSRTLASGTGLTGGGDLTADRTLALDSATQTSLGLADTAVQPTTERFRQAIAVGDETTDLTTSDTVTFRATDAFTLSEVRASVNTAPVGATIIVDVLLNVTTSGSNITGVPCNFGTGRDLVSQAAFEPTLGTLGGVDAFNFTANERIEYTMTSTDFTDITVFQVIQQTVGNGAGTTVYINSGTDYYHSRIFEDNYNRDDVYAGSLSRIIGSAADTTTAPVIFASRYDSAAQTHTHWTNGGAPSGENTPVLGGNISGITSISIGARADNWGNSPFSGQIGEVIVYNTPVSLSDINSIGDYLANIYGTTWTTAT